jgi:hypothetical protein
MTLNPRGGRNSAANRDVTRAALGHYAVSLPPSLYATEIQSPVGCLPSGKSGSASEKSRRLRWVNGRAGAARVIAGRAMPTGGKIGMNPAAFIRSA